MSFISTKNIKKVYKAKDIEILAAHNINLSFTADEFTAIVGPSGSGKTTLLNLLGGLDKPSEGQIYIDGMDFTKLSSNQLIEYRLHHIGFVFQSHNLVPVLTVKENIEFVMLLQKRSVRERDKRSRELLEAIGLLDRMNSRPAQLSGGEQQRVAVARALASKPKFVLADEPTANLDSVSAESLLSIMENLNKDEKVAFIFSTHDPRVVSKAKRVIRIKDGCVISDES